MNGVNDMKKYSKRNAIIAGVSIFSCVFIWTVIRVQQSFSVPEWIIGIGVVLMFLSVILLNFTYVELSILYSIVLISFNLGVVLTLNNVNEINESVLLTAGIIFSVTLGSFFINIIRNTWHFMRMKEPNNALLKAIFPLRYIYPLVMYMIAIVIVIICFTAVYESLNLYYYNEGLIEEGLLLATSPEVLASEYDLLYFSFVTYFTIGYGDIIPSGTLVKFVAEAEMLIGSLINTVVAPTLIGLIFLSNNKNNEERTN